MVCNEMSDLFMGNSPSHKDQQSDLKSAPAGQIRRDRVNVDAPFITVVSI
jgi:hypothetical protein